jgi:hypothetical protein
VAPSWRTSLRESRGGFNNGMQRTALRAAADAERWASKIKKAI